MVSLAAGVASFVILPVLGAVVAAITGHMARREIRRTGEGGGSLALTGIILGYVHLALFLIGVVLLILGFGHHGPVSNAKAGSRTWVFRGRGSSQQLSLPSEEREE